jgi:Tfp pilus assembly protein PilF
MNTRGHKSLHIAYQRRTWQLLPFVLSLLGFISSGAPGFSSPATNLCQNARPALVTLFSVDPRFQWPSYQGSGFLISDDGIVVTARHVAEGELDLFAITADGKRHAVTGFLGEDLDYDVAVLKLTGTDWPHLLLSTGSLPQTNQWVAVISPEPNGGTTCSTGAVRSVPALQNLWAVIATTIRMHPGQSGSPLVDETGKVVGVVSGLDNAQRGSAMPITIVEEILTNASLSAPVAFKERPRGHSREPLALDKDFRVAVECMRTNDWQAAQNRCKRLASRFPDSPMVNLVLGVLYIKRESWKQADVALGKVVRQKPRSGLAWYLYGVTCAERGRYDESDVALKKSMELGLFDQGQVASAWNLMAIINAKRNNTQGVREALDNLKRLDPSEASNCVRELRRDFPRLNLPLQEPQP